MRNHIAAAGMIALASGGACLAREYSHQRIGAFTDVIGIQLFETGDHPVVAENDAQSENPISDLYVNGVNYTAGILPGWHRSNGGYIRGNGAIFHGVTLGSPGVKRYHLFINDFDRTAARFGAEHNSHWYRFNSRGRIAPSMSPSTRTIHGHMTRGWMTPMCQRMFWVLWASGTRHQSTCRRTVICTGTAGGGSNGSNSDFFLDDVNLTGHVLGINRSSGYLHVNDNGDWAWDGSGSLTGGRRHVFVGERDLTARVFGANEHTGFIRGISAAGEVAWLGRAGPFLPDDIYKDTTNLSGFLGAGRRVGYDDTRIALTGRVPWSGEGGLLGSNHDVYVDRTNVSMPVLGEDRSVRLQGITSDGAPVWVGNGTPNPHWDLFLGEFNVSADAFSGGGGYYPWAATANARGEVLWIVSRNGMREVWLSRPVPEPSALPLGLPALLVLRRRR